MNNALLLSGVLNKPPAGSGEVTYADLNTKLDITMVGAANGAASLDNNQKVPLSQINDSVLGQVEYKGIWDAAANLPELQTTPAEKGHYYVTGAAGSRFGLSFAVGDWVISNGVTWDKVLNTDAVTSVAGRTGAVTLSASDVGLGNVTNVAQAPATHVGSGGAAHAVVTTSVAGFMSAADKTKLDGVATGATAYTDASARAACVATTITNGVTTSAPNQNAVFDALALKANLASPTLTGTPAAPTAAVATNTTQIATTAYVKSQAATVAPSAPAAVAAVGTATVFARQDHVHPSRISLTAPASPVNGDIWMV